MAKIAKHLEVKARHIYKPEIEKCPHCQEPLQERAYYQWRKTVQQLDGAIYVASRAKECANPACDHQGYPYISAAAQMITVPECTYGLDVIAQVGWWRDREHLNREQIHAYLAGYGVQLCERQVDHLYAQYQVLLGCAARLDKEKLAQVAEDQGGLRISIDGLAPEGAAEQLWVVREVQTATTLVVGWLPRVNHTTLAVLLEPVQALGLSIAATVSDKQSSVRKALQEVWGDVPHQWCQSHYLGNATRPIYERDSSLKTEMRKTIRAEIRESTGDVLTATEAGDCDPQIVTGAAVDAVPLPEDPHEPATCAEVVRELALDLQQALARTGRAPFVLSGLPMFDDLCAIQHALEQCLQIRDDPHLREWYEVLERTLPQYRSPFAEVETARAWVADIADILDVPFPTDDEPGLGGDEVARRMAHHLGSLADLDDLSPWLMKFRHDLLARSERYWSGLFHCYNIVGLPATNNEHESLYGQVKRQLRRQLGVSDLREPLLRRGAWTVLQIDVSSPAELQARLEQVRWEEYAAERARYERRQAQFRRRYRWRHHRDAVLQQRVADWAEAVPDC